MDAETLKQVMAAWRAVSREKLAHDAACDICRRWLPRRRGGLCPCPVSRQMTVRAVFLRAEITGAARVRGDNRDTARARAATS